MSARSSRSTYSASARTTEIEVICERYERAADRGCGRGARRHGDSRSAGSFGRVGVLSFNGNKIVTTSGGGALVSDDGDLIDRAFHLATQARGWRRHYEHSEIGYNYRLSNLLAAVGRAQLETLEERIAARRRIFVAYAERLGDIEGLVFMPEARLRARQSLVDDPHHRSRDRRRKPR